MTIKKLGRLTPIGPDEQPVNTAAGICQHPHRVPFLPHSFPHHLIPHQALDPNSSPTHSLSLWCSRDLYYPLRTQVNHHLLRETFSIYSWTGSPPDHALSPSPTLFFTWLIDIIPFFWFIISCPLPACTNFACLVHNMPSVWILLGTKWVLNKYMLMTGWKAQEKNKVGAAWINKSQKGSSL